MPSAPNALSWGMISRTTRSSMIVSSATQPGVLSGETVGLRVTLRPFAGAEYVETVPVMIPRAVAGQTVKLEVASGASVRPDQPQAESLRVYIDNLRKSYPATSLVVTVQTPADGASLRGQLISGLPDSALDTLRSVNQTRRADAYHITDRTVFPVRQLVSGKQEMSVQVKEDALGAGDRRARETGPAPLQ